MIAYNKLWLANLRLRERLKEDADNGLITSSEYEAICAKYPVGFYTPNIFVRGGLILLTSFIISCADGFLSLGILSGGVDISAWFVILGALTYGALELMIRAKFHYRSGVDDALLIIAAVQIGGGLSAAIIDNQHPQYLLILGIVTLLGLGLSLRFADRLIVAATSISLLIFLFYSWMRIIPMGLATAPFAMMLFNGVLYWLSYKFSKQANLINYHSCLDVVQIVALIGFFASGNYYVVQNLGAELAGRKGVVPFAPVFWIWTFAVPILYIVTGLSIKSSMLLRVGLLLLAVAGFTFRAYHQISPLEVMLTIIGAAVLIGVYLISRYLKAPKHGITVDEPAKERMMDKLKVESLVAAGSFTHAPQAPSNNGDKFGGGSFGGGGSSSSF